MYKSLCVAVLLLAAFALTSGSKSADASAPVVLSSPQIVAKVNLTNLTSIVPQRTIFTPTQTGLYRLSPYMASLSPSSTCCWFLNFYWTDEGGPQTDLDLMVLEGLYGTDLNLAVVGSFSFRAVAGQPVSFDVSNGGSNQPAYQLSLVIERLE